MSVPPPYRQPPRLALADRDVEPENLEQRAKQPDERSSRFAGWLRDLDALLSAEEREILHRRVAEMSPDRLERVAALTPEEAATELRREIRGGWLPSLTSRTT